jgi:hypothetical protein
MASTSKIEICNIALSIIGADSIRNFDENNKRSRMCDVLYESARDELLSSFDWSFARRIAKLQQVPTDTGTHPPGLYAYKLPNDCKVPRDLWPPGSFESWFLLGNILYCKQDNIEDGVDIFLVYTGKEINTTMFSDTFANTLAILLASRLAGPITQDKNLTKTLYDQFRIEYQNAIDIDANLGNQYKYPDGISELDSFVTGEKFNGDPQDTSIFYNR